jgi:hypothetical protein
MFPLLSLMADARPERALAHRTKTSRYHQSSARRDSSSGVLTSRNFQNAREEAAAEDVRIHFMLSRPNGGEVRTHFAFLDDATNAMMKSARIVAPRAIAIKPSTLTRHSTR